MNSVLTLHFSPLLTLLSRWHYCYCLLESDRALLRLPNSSVLKQRICYLYNQHVSDSTTKINVERFFNTGKLIFFCWNTLAYICHYFPLPSLEHFIYLLHVPLTLNINQMQTFNMLEIPCFIWTVGQITWVMRALNLIQTWDWQIFLCHYREEIIFFKCLTFQIISNG